MIWLYTGTPGSGKSLDMAQDIMSKVGRGQNVICNFQINQKMIKGKYKGKCICVKDEELSPKFLYDYAIENHMKKKGKKGFEGQTLLVIDEAQRLFGAKIRIPNRVSWMTFFQLHRHYGYNIIFATQMKKSIVGELLGLVEYEVKHRKLNNFKLFGAVLGLLCGGALFVAVEYWTGSREKTNARYFRYSRRLHGLYDSYANFDEEYDAGIDMQILPTMNMQKVRTSELSHPQVIIDDFASPSDLDIAEDDDFTMIDLKRIV